MPSLILLPPLKKEKTSQEHIYSNTMLKQQNKPTKDFLYM